MSRRDWLSIAIGGLLVGCWGAFVYALELGPAVAIAGGVLTGIFYATAFRS